MKNNKLHKFPNDFITLSSLKSSLLKSYIWNNKPEFYYYTKSGKTKKIKIKKSYKFQCSFNKLLEFENDVKYDKNIEIISECSDESNYSKTYAINANAFLSSLNNHITDLSYVMYPVINPNTLNVFNLMDICYRQAYLLDKNNNKIIEVRYDL